ncbi:uncharacterized protein LAESUDRAFT_689269 [Laetiporus sulphureus 93-53]|uniref:Uncharacterized protein n=1 Tax=Laetiporus sulphureus 93-53 TaxID=1314785 RepID=A0A165I4N3_9APHY|nr:uncharacterized protein LAESUDRAFT_689269 [Laetiporus sulphureus 93-53]KZT12589.1 hypothetical protein LAESUDRAFT_689269 [Laetiporus sulphureus 93-53]
MASQGIETGLARWLPQDMLEDFIDDYRDVATTINLNRQPREVLAEALRHLSRVLLVDDWADRVRSHVNTEWSSLKNSRRLGKELTEEDVAEWHRIFLDALQRDNWQEFINAPFVYLPETPTNRGNIVALDDKQQKAVVDSWKATYIGEVPQALWEHLNRHCDPEAKRFKVYAHYAAIVQSSGMGKSRAIDELARSHLTIHMNLNYAKATGYPPPDSLVRSHLVFDTRDRAFVNNKILAFLEALFKVTEDRLKDKKERLHVLASDFRMRMNDGMTFQKHGAYRHDFFSEEHYATTANESQTIREPPTPPGPKDPSRAVFRPGDACLRLMNVLKQADERKKKEERCGAPYLILAFDEAHAMTTQVTSPTGEAWSAFYELRAALRSLMSYGVFSLFLSTTGRISQFLSPRDQEFSMRLVTRQLTLISPFTDLGFDFLAERIKGEDGFTLAHVTTDEFMCHLGRPLFGSRYDAADEDSSIREDIVQFAMAKLLATSDFERDLNDDQKLACLSQRLALEFNSTNYLEQGKEKLQVEGHMRVCLKLDETFESMVSVSGSEPILAEAAYAVMQHDSFDVPNALKKVLEGFAVNKGDRGELLAMLLMTLARDAAVGKANAAGKPESGVRYVSVVSFFEELFGGFGKNANLERAGHDRGPWDWNTTSPNDFQKDFQNSYVYFNHFIKVHDYGVLDADYLLAIFSRGGAVLCANNQRAIDGVAMMVHGRPSEHVENIRATRETLGFIMWQVKNDASYTDQRDDDLFRVMDPFKLNIWKAGLDKDRVSTVKASEQMQKWPVIRIVFALASAKPALSIRRTEITQGGARFRAYDIWCAGLSPAQLKPITDVQSDVWDALLQASYGWKDRLYKGLSTTLESLRRSQDAGAAADNRNFRNWEFPQR